MQLAATPPIVEEGHVIGGRRFHVLGARVGLHQQGPRPALRQGPFGHGLQGWPLLETYAVVLANMERVQHLGRMYQLVWHAGAAGAARAHSWDQLRRGYVSHESPEGEDVAVRLRRFHIFYHAAGENIAWLKGAGGPTWANVARIHRGLMDSPGHRANLLEPRFRSLGVGIAADAGQIVVTQVFVA